jgi:hypothetical protein
MLIRDFSWLGLALIAAVPLLSAAAPSRQVFTDGDGQRHRLTDLAGRPAILVFWRSDCGPCLIELKNIQQLRAAAQPARLITIAIQPHTAGLAADGSPALPAAENWSANGDPAAVLTAFNGAPPRLPLAVALTAGTKICDRHLGLLGTDRVAEWARRC